MIFSQLALVVAIKNLKAPVLALLIFLQKMAFHIPSMVTWSCYEQYCPYDIVPVRELDIFYLQVFNNLPALLPSPPVLVRPLPPLPPYSLPLPLPPPPFPLYPTPMYEYIVHCTSLARGITIYENKIRNISIIVLYNYVQYILQCTLYRTVYNGVHVGVGRCSVESKVHYMQLNFIKSFT